MCPNHQMLSLYFDDELPSPWKEKMESHLKGCPECRAVLEGYGFIGKHLDDVSDETIRRAQERVWDKIISPDINASPQKKQVIYRHGAWNRSITLPLPAAAAAAVLIIIAMFALFGMRGRSINGQSGAMAVIPELPVYMQTMQPMQPMQNDHGVLPVTDMTGVLQYLSNQDNGDFMVIRLPESTNFIRAGEPALINASDYSKRQGSR